MDDFTIDDILMHGFQEFMKYNFNELDSRSDKLDKEIAEHIRFLISFSDMYIIDKKYRERNLKI